MTIETKEILCEVLNNKIWIKRDKNSGEVYEIDCPYYEPNEPRIRCLSMEGICVHEYRKFQKVPDKLIPIKIDSKKIIYLKDHMK